MSAKQKGFTIVELLIVIVVIAILASLSIVAFNGIQNRAYDSAISSDLATLVKKVELLTAEAGTTYYNRPTFPDSIDVRISKSSYMPNRNNLYVCNDDTKFALAGISKSGKAFSYSTGSGYVTHANGSSFSIASTCSLIGITYSEPMPVGTGAFAGYDWNTSTSTGAWDSWAKS